MVRGFTIYQLNHVVGSKVPYAFENFDPFIFNFKDYKMVYENEVETESVELLLEDLYMIFNSSYIRVERGFEDFNGHSLSVSDIIFVDGEYYYVEYFGFKNITKFISEKVHR